MCPKTLLITTVLLVASASIAQEHYHSTDPDLMARLSYDRSGVVQRGEVRHVCIAVSRDGDYRIVRLLDNGQTERLKGKLGTEEFNHLTKLLKTPEFRSLSGEHSGVIRQEAESFAAEIRSGDTSRADGTGKGMENDAWRLQWLNGDGRNPFPASVSKLVRWLRHFQPTNGESFEYAEYPDVCPAGGLRLLQPSVAENSHH